MSPSFPNKDTTNSWCCCWASAWDLRRASKLSCHSPWIYVWILAVTSCQGLRAPCHCCWAFSSSFWSFFLLLSIFSSFLCNLTIAFSSGGWLFLWFLAAILISSQQNIVGIITATILFVGFRFLDKSRIYFVWWSHEFVCLHSVWTFSVPFPCDCCFHIHFCIYPTAPATSPLTALVIFQNPLHCQSTYFETASKYLPICFSCLDYFLWTWVYHSTPYRQQLSISPL